MQKRTRTISVNQDSKVQATLRILLRLANGNEPLEGTNVLKILDLLKTELYASAITEAGGNNAKAGRILGIGAPTLFEYCRRRKKRIKKTVTVT
jgi:hypothetical protein